MFETGVHYSNTGCGLACDIELYGNVLSVKWLQLRVKIPVHVISTPNGDILDCEYRIAVDVCPG